MIPCLLQIYHKSSVSRFLNIDSIFTRALFYSRAGYITAFMAKNVLTPKCTETIIKGHRNKLSILASFTLKQRKENRDEDLSTFIHSADGDILYFELFFEAVKSGDVVISGLNTAIDVSKILSSYQRPNGIEEFSRETQTKLLSLACYEDS